MILRNYLVNGQTPGKGFALEIPAGFEESLHRALRGLQKSECFAGPSRREGFSLLVFSISVDQR